MTSSVWRSNSDEVKSAHAIIAKSIESSDVVSPIPLPEILGFEALPFALPQILRQWGGKLQEIALDSAFNTNGSCFDVFALMGEIHGSGIPLGFLFVHTNNGESHGKQKLIEAFLTFVQTSYELNMSCALTDKDWSEINAFQTVFPDAKIQLCFWHCCVAVKKRLSILHHAPAFYNVEQACAEFVYQQDLYSSASTWLSEVFLSINIFLYSQLFL